MQVARLDHLVLTVRDLNLTEDFYTRVLSMRVETFGSGRRALMFGEQKINLHAAGGEFDPKADRPTPGSADLCFDVMTTQQTLDLYLECIGIRRNTSVVAWIDCQLV